jgi:putative aldouronate transport system permease protein
MICLFVAVGAWNSWFDTYLYTSAKPDLYSLQYVLMQFLNSSQNQSNSAADANSMAVAAAAGSSGSMVTPITLRSSITVIATLPILVVYPFMQRYFVVGMTIGGVKE